MSAKESGIFNVGTGKARSFQDIVDILQNELGTNLPCEYIPNPFVGSYQFHTEADISTTKEVLGYEPVLRWKMVSEPMSIKSEEFMNKK